MNRRITRIGLCVSLMLLLLLCVSGCKKETYEFPEELAEQLPQTTNYNVHKFVLDERLEYWSPIVRWNLNGAELFMMVDTGCYENLLWKNGIKKALPDLAVTSSYKADGVKIMAEIEKSTYWLDPYAFWAGGFEDTCVDGCIGLTWLKRYNNIVLDYVNNRIDYNQPPINDYDIPMEFGNYSKKYSVPFTFNGKEMLGLIDTGSYATFVNLPIIGEKRGEDGLYIVHDFSIGNVHYENMEIKGGDDVGCAEGVRRMFAEDNVLGYSCFKDHVIQLDFKNNVFRIK